MSSVFDLSIHELPVIELEGTHYQMGRTYGEICREKMAELYEVRLLSALKHASTRGREFSVEHAVELADECITEVKAYDPLGYKELMGMSEGSGLSMQEIYIMQGLTDFRDFLTWGQLPDGLGCTSMIVSRERSASGQLILAQNWDLMTSNMPYVCFVKRKPEIGPETMSLTVTGGLSMIGLNSEGLAIGTNNIKTTDSRRGVHYLNIIHRALSCATASEAEHAIQYAHRSGAHYYMLGDKSGDYYGIECSATKHGILKGDAGVVTHCNHPLHPEVASLNAEDMGESTQYRQKRIDSLVSDGAIGVSEIKEILSDYDGGDLAICRRDVGEGISTNGSVIIEPEAGRIHACRSLPDEGVWQTFEF